MSCNNFSSYFDTQAISNTYYHFFSVIGVIKSLGVSKSQALTAKAIVKINKDLGLFVKYFPSEWLSWGEKREYWYVVGFGGLGIVTSLIIGLYQAPEKDNSKYHLDVYRVIANNGLHVREKPNTNSISLKVLKKGEIVIALSSLGSWIEIDIDGDGKSDGYCSKAYLSEVK